MGLLKMPHEIETKNIRYKILIYGQPGLGKSTLALSMPSPVLIDADNGVHRIAPAHRVPTLQVTSYDEVLQLISSPELAPFETLVIDTAGKLLDYINAYVIRQNGKNGRGGGQLTMQGWGARASTFSALTKAITTMGKHVVFVAHDKEDKDGENRYIRPDFGGGKSGADLMKDLDIVGYMEASNGNQRTISFVGTDHHVAKNSARIQNSLIVPDLNVPGTTNDLLTQVIHQCEEASKAEAVQGKEFADLLARIDSAVDAISDADTANGALSEIASLPVIWDSKQRAWNALKAKTESLGLSYDREKKLFVSAAA